MVTQKMSQHYQHVLTQAHVHALRGGAESLTMTHMCQALIEERGSIAFELMHKLGFISLEEEPSAVGAIDSSEEIATSLTVTYSSDVQQVIRGSVLLASQQSHHYIGTEHLLLSMVNHDPSILRRLLNVRETDIRELVSQLKAVLRNTTRFGDITAGFISSDISDDDALMPELTKRPNRSEQGRARERMLDYVATDLTHADVQKRINPVIGRDEEIERIVQILARRDKNNPVLIGEPGVGKTAIVEGLAKRVVEGMVPDTLLGKKIYNLDLSLLVAGAMYRGEFESRLKQLIDEIREDSSIIVFIDELHTIVGAGAATGSLDAANILKPALARGEVRMIGATTLSEFKMHIEPDSALERRLQAIVVAEPSIDESVKILTGIKSAYEHHHRVAIEDDAIAAAVKLSHQYITEKFLPDKAIDLLDEAAARVRVKQIPDASYREAKQQEQRLKEVIEQKHAAVEEENFPEALRLKEQERQIQASLEQPSLTMTDTAPVLQGSINEHDIAQLIARVTGIPVGELVTREVKRIKNLEKHLSRHIIGQDTALKTVVQAIQRAQVGLADPSRPLASFMFLGPSGVGKTETAKVLAREVFHDPKALIRFDMSEFSERFNVSRLLGAPAGYVGYKEGGQLTEAVRRRPYSVVLFDEIEKAHPEVFNILLQILDEGVVSDAVGKRVDFRNTIIILTSNVGLKQFTQMAEIGFSSDTSSRQSNARIAEQRAHASKNVLEVVRRTFRPEFLNRLDRMIVYEPLTLANIQKIMTRELKELSRRLKERNITLKVSPKLVRHIAKQSFNPQEGARSIRRVLSDRIVSPVTDKVLAGEIERGSQIKLTMADDHTLSFEISSKPTRS